MKKFLENIFETKGIRKTQARIQVIEALNGSHEPVSVRQLTSILSKAKIDTATVYRTLDLLIHKGVVRRVETGLREAHFELVDIHEDHHHLICVQCNKVIDFQGCESDSVIQQALDQTQEFSSVLYHSFDLFGICNTCSKDQ